MNLKATSHNNNPVVWRTGAGARDCRPHRESFFSKDKQPAGKQEFFLSRSSQAETSLFSPSGSPLATGRIFAETAHRGPVGQIGWKEKWVQPFFFRLEAADWADFLAEAFLTAFFAGFLTRVPTSFFGSDGAGSVDGAASRS